MKKSRMVISGLLFFKLRYEAFLLGSSLRIRSHFNFQTFNFFCDMDLAT